MAKDEKGTDDYKFEVPDFDEDAFIHKEMVSFRTTVILFVWGIVAALISWGIWEATGANKTGWYLGLLVMGAMAYLLRFVYKALKVDISHFGRREWFGTFFLLFFAWLSFFILFINPPISDHADPTALVFASPSVQQEGGDVHLELFAADNSRVEAIQFTLMQGASIIANEDDLAKMETGHWSYDLNGAAAGQYAYTFTVEDSRGNEAIVTGDFRVGSRTLRVDIPSDGLLDSPGDEIIVTVSDMDPCTPAENRDGGDCLRTVYLDLENGNQIAMEFDESLGWYARAAFAGWDQGNNSFRVVAEQQNQFQGLSMIEGGEIVLDGPFTIDVQAILDDYSTNVAPEVTVPPVTRRTPGFGAVALVAILVGFVALARRQE